MRTNGRKKRKCRRDAIPDAKKEQCAPAGRGRALGRILQKMRGEVSGHYDDMKQQIDMEKNGQVTLDAAQLRTDSIRPPRRSPP